MGARGRRVNAALALALFIALASVGCGAAAVSLRPHAALPAHAGTVSAGEYLTQSLTVPAGYASAGRPFLLHIKRGQTRLRPLVLLLHGLYQHPGTVEKATGATAFSDAHNFTLVYPIGVDEAWNAGGCCRADIARDVTYLVDLVHYVATLTPTDLHRVYIWGFSNGGMMAWRAVCQTHDVFAGAGVMAGTLLVPCPRQVHVVEIHGTRDTTVPYFGGYSRYTGTVFPDAAREHSELVAGSTLEVHLVKGLGHRWPPLTRGTLDALQVFWDELAQYRVDHPAVPVAVSPVRLG